MMLDKLHDPNQQLRDPGTGSLNSSVARFLQIILKTKYDMRAVRICREYLERAGVGPPLDGEETRARALAHIVRPYVQEPLLDFGCGSGLTSWALQPTQLPMNFDPEAGNEPPLVPVQFDLSDGRDDRCKGFPFATNLKEVSRHAETMGKFTTLLIEVLHHTQDPAKMLRSLMPFTRRFIIIEPVVDTLVSRPVQALMDWFFVRVVLQSDMDIPNTWKTGHEWHDVFEAPGLKLVHRVKIGTAFPHAYEDLRLYVVDVENGEILARQLSAA